ncbi:MAG: hypothetical protein Q8R36_01625 [bacterium]|nr:hypothetical protein [bacterium]
MLEPMFSVAVVLGYAFFAFLNYRYIRWLLAYTLGGTVAEKNERWGIRYFGWLSFSVSFLLAGHNGDPLIAFAIIPFVHTALLCSLEAVFDTYAFDFKSI